MIIRSRVQRSVKYIVIPAIAILASCRCGTRDNNLQVFRYNQASGITSIDPAFSKDQANIWAVNQVFNGLLQLDDQLRIRPCIARSWQISDDGLIYTFQLRQDVFFHPHELFPEGKGRKVRAQDFVYSFHRVISKGVGAWIFNNRVEPSEPFTALNDSTLRIRLQRRFPPFLSILTMQYCSVVPKEIAEHYGDDFRKQPVGTGPFMFKSWEEGVGLVLVRNPNYFETDESGHRLPYLDAVQVSFVQDKHMEYLKFMTGELDLLSGLDVSFKDELLTSSGTLRPGLADRINIEKLPYLNTEYLGFLLQQAPDGNSSVLLNKKVRQAINYGIDRVKMVRFFRNNIGIPAQAGFVPPFLYNGESGGSVSGFSYQPAKALQLLREAGYPEGRGLGEIILFTNPSYMDLCIFIQKELENIGVRIKVENTQPGTLREWMAQSKVGFFRGSWVADYPDAESFLTVFYGQNPAPPNYTRFSLPAFDSLYLAAMQEQNPALRKKLFLEMESTLLEEAPVIPLYYDQVVRFTRKNISGLGANPMNLLILKKARTEVPAVSKS